MRDLPEEQYWPVRLIKHLARFPHENRTWLGPYHTIPNGPDYDPFLAGSELCGSILLEPNGRFTPLAVHDDNLINFYLVLPATRAEIEYKLGYGMEALDKKFMEADLPVEADIYRKSTV